VLTGTSEEVLLFLWGRYDRDRVNLSRMRAPIAIVEGGNA